MGAFEPKGALSSTTASACVHRAKGSRGCIRGARQQRRSFRFYLLLTPAGDEGGLLLRVVVDGLGDGLQPLVPLRGCAVRDRNSQPLTTNERRLKAFQ